VRLPFFGSFDYGAGAQGDVDAPTYVELFEATEEGRCGCRRDLRNGYPLNNTRVPVKMFSSGGKERLGYTSNCASR
jgi:hypothetical protein